MSTIINFSKWMLIALVAIATTIGTVTIFYGTSLQMKYDGITGKVISEILSPTLHPDAMKKVYMPMANTLLDTGDMAMTTIIRVPVADDVSNEDVKRL